MALPTKQQLESQSEETKNKIRRLEEAYKQFEQKWSDIAQEEQKMAEELRGFVDKAKIHNILNTIHSIKE